MDAKPLIKEALQAEVGLPVDSKIPVIGFIGRLEEQKGSDILATAISEFIDEDVQIIVLVIITTLLLAYFHSKEFFTDGCFMAFLRGLAKSKWRSSSSSWRYYTQTRPEGWQNLMFHWPI